MMDILNFEKKHIEKATAIARANYYDERQFVKELPQVRDIPDLNGFAENGLGVVAFEDEKMIGFLCCCGQLIKFCVKVLSNQTNTACLQA